MKREAGILLPVSSLPGTLGIGDFGECAYEWVDLLDQSGVGLWQILPLNPLGYGNSPYQAYSSFAGDEIYISIEKLFLDMKIPYQQEVWASNFIAYEAVRARK
ncbi:MAG TPA: 4-alpha-glucanotransferase, partial [Erysipelothrix sp.]